MAHSFLIFLCSIMNNFSQQDLLGDAFVKGNISHTVHHKEKNHPTPLSARNIEKQITCMEVMTELLARLHDLSKCISLKLF